MNSWQLHQRGLVDDRTALQIALIADGWTDEEAVNLVDRYAAAAVETQPRHWQRWADEELALIEKAIAEAGGKIPPTAVTRPLAVKLGRKHKSVLSAIERRLAKGGRPEQVERWAEMHSPAAAEAVIEGRGDQ